MLFGAMITDGGATFSVADHFHEALRHDPLDIPERTPAGGYVPATGQAAIFDMLSPQEQKHYLWGAHGLVL